MTQNQIASLRHPGFPGRAVSHRVNGWLLAIRSIAVYALVTQCLPPARAADALPVKEPGTQTTPARKPAYAPKGYQMERYQAFARQAEIPAITVTDTTTLEVGGTVRIDLNRLAQLSNKEQEALGGQIGFPVAVIGKVAERAAGNPPPDAAQFAHDIRTAVVDYRFLHGEWNRYDPPAAGQRIKADALQALQSGDIIKAWELYDGLQRPAPPGNLRIVAQP
jgi:hypothetical protein